MSKFFKKLREKEARQQNSDSITNYLIAEIEDIVAKKVGNYNISYKNEKELESYPVEKKYRSIEDQGNEYLSSINYNLNQEQPFKASKYINTDSDVNFLPFEENELQPQVNNEEQIKSIVKRTLRPALNQWLDDNLDIIIEKAIKRNKDKYLTKNKRRRRYYEEE